MKKTGLILLISSFWLFVSGYFTNIHAQDETLTILTYYPAPYGVYNRLQIGSNPANGILLEASDVSPNAGYIRFGDNTGWKLHFGRYRESAGGAANTGTTGLLMTIQDTGGVGIGTRYPASDRLDILTTVNSLTSGVANLPVRIRKGSNNDDEGVGIGFTAATGSSNIGAKIVHERIGSYSRGNLAFYTKPTTGGSGDTTTEKMRITANGRVGIGTNLPQSELDIGGLTGTTTASTQLHLGGEYNQGPNDDGIKLLIDRYDNEAQTTILRAVDENNNIDWNVRSAPTQNGIPRMFFRGNLWVGEETSEAHRFRSVTPGGIAVYAKSTASYALWAESEQSAAIYTRTSNQASATIEAFHTNGGTAIFGRSTSVAGSGTGVYGEGKQYGIYGNSNNYAGYFSGKVTATNTKSRLSSPFDHSGHLYDIAELIPCAKDVEYGDVVVINPEKDREAIRCTNENQSAAGIISENPQFSLGDREKAREEEPEKNWNFLALAGQVYVKVDATFGEIKRGDLLSVSSTPGHAMKAKPIGEINGHAIYPQGCIVGKALAPQKEGRGKIPALVCLM